MRPPATLIRAGVAALPCIGDGRQSDISGSPSILNASPEVAVGIDGYGYPESQTPWQEIHRDLTSQFASGAVLEPAVKYRRVAQRFGMP